MLPNPAAVKPKEGSSKNVFFDNDDLDSMAKHFIGNMQRLGILGHIHLRIPSQFGCFFPDIGRTWSFPRT